MNKISTPSHEWLDTPKYCQRTSLVEAKNLGKWFLKHMLTIHSCLYFAVTSPLFSCGGFLYWFPETRNQLFLMCVIFSVTNGIIFWRWESEPHRVKNLCSFKTWESNKAIARLRRGIRYQKTSSSCCGSDLVFAEDFVPWKMDSTQGQMRRKGKNWEYLNTWSKVWWQDELYVYIQVHWLMILERLRYQESVRKYNCGRWSWEQDI